MSGGQKSIERQAGTRVMHAPLTQDWSTTAESAALGDVTPGPCLPLAPGPRIGNLTSSFLPEEGLLGGSDSKESACNAGDLGSVPGSGRSPREGNGNSLQYSCLENPMDRGAWQATVHGVAKSWTRLRD